MTSPVLLECDQYLINLKKDYGRLIFSSDIIEIFNPQIFEGNDCNYDNLSSDGYLNNILESTTYTKSAKKTKKLLLEHFLNTSKKKYIVVFEDDTYLHIDMFDKSKKNNIFKQLNNFIQKKSPKLLYFGTSRHFTSENLYTTNIKFVSFNEQFKNEPDLCSGAYGFILRRDMIPTVLMRIKNDTLENMPFDLFCLSYIGKTYPNECFVTNPHIIVPNIEGSNIRASYNQNIVWNTLMTKKELYHTNKVIGIMYVSTNVDTNIDTINHFNKTITCLTPIIKVVYVNNQFKKTNETNTSYQFIIRCDIEIKIKYFSGKNIIDTIIENNKFCKFLEISNSTQILFKIEYANGLKNLRQIMLFDII